MHNADYNFLRKFKFNNIKLDSKYEGCTAGEKLITIGVDGGIYACQTLVNDPPICGLTPDLLSNLRSQNQYKIGYNYEPPSDCVSCSILDICGGGCKLHNKKENREHFCDLTKEVLLYVMKKVIK